MRALEAEPLSLAGLRQALGSPPQTTLRTQLRGLVDLGALERDREVGVPHSVGHALTGAGEELLAAADTLERWLAGSPRSPIPLGEIAAKHTVKALADGWSSGIVAVVAAKSPTLTELGQEIGGLSYPSVERRVSAMRAAGLIETGESSGHGAPCLPTAWLRRAAAPIAAAARFERSVAGTREARVDIQTLLTLAMPLARPPQGACGTAMLVARESGPEGREEGAVTAGVIVELRDGRLHSRAAGLEGSAPTWALGTPDAWLEAAADGTLGRLRFGGVDPKLARNLAWSFHVALQTREPRR